MYDCLGKEFPLFAESSESPASSLTQNHEIVVYKKPSRLCNATCQVEEPMPFNVGDVVSVWTPDVIRRGKLALILQVLPTRLSEQDFREYVVEFPDAASERFRFCMYREFELQRDRLEEDESGGR